MASCGLTTSTTCIEATTGLTCHEFNQKWFQAINEPLGEQCLSDPFEVQMVYNGGSCNQSFIQLMDPEEDGYRCQDMLGGPPTTRGEASWIEVLSTSGISSRRVYFSDLVHVGDVFDMVMPDMEAFSDTVYVDVYEVDASTKASTGVLRQRVQLPFDCKLANIGGLDRYGALQFVGFASTEQGYQSYYADFTGVMSMNVTLALTNSNAADPGPIQLDVLTMASNTEPFFFNFTEGLPPVIPYGTSHVVEFQIDFPMSYRSTFNALVTRKGTKKAGACRNTDLVSFQFEDLPPIFDTIAPTNVVKKGSDVASKFDRRSSSGSFP